MANGNGNTSWMSVGRFAWQVAVTIALVALAWASLDAAVAQLHETAARHEVRLDGHDRQFGELKEAMGQVRMDTAVIRTMLEEDRRREGR